MYPEHDFVVLGKARLMQQQVGSEKAVLDTITSLSKQDLLLLLLALVFAVLPVAPAPKSIALVLMLSFWLFSGVCWTERRRWLGQDWFVPVLLLFLLPWIGLLWSPDKAAGFSVAKRSVYWLYALPAASVAYGRYRSKFLVYAFLSGLCLNLVVSILQYLDLVPKYKGQGYGFISYISYSLLLVAGMLFLAYLYREDQRWPQRLAVLAGLLLLVWNLVISPGRIGYLAFILALPWILTLMFSKRQMVWILVCGMLALGALVTSPVVRSRMEAIRQDITQYQQGQGMTSIGLRLHMWQGALTIWKEHPVLGVGTGGYRHALKQVINPEYAIFSHPHNSVLFMAVSYGTVGVVILGWLVFVVVRRGWRARATTEGQIILVSMFVIGVGSLTDTQIMGHATGVLLGIVCGLYAGGGEQQCQDTCAVFVAKG